jgi:MFS family permease
MTAATGIHRTQWRTIILSSLGGALEFYDFVVYAMFARYIGAAFFPATDQLTSLIYSFSVFAGGYLARPLGGIVFSHYGDKYGRRKVFIVSILSMSAATLGMGLLPTYAAIGAAAPMLMIFLRLVQGFSLGGELPGAITFVVETAPRRAGFAAGVIFFCVNSGVALASGLSLGVHAFLDAPQVADWGWRIGFLVGGVLGLVSFWLRLSLEETAEFKQMHPGTTARRPFADLVSSHPAQVLVATAALIASGAFNGLLFAMPSFLPQVMGYTPNESIQAQNLCLIITSFGLLFTAWLGDRIPRHRILGLGAFVILVFSVPFFSAAANHSVNIFLLFAAAGIAASLIHGPMSCVAADLFPTRIRFSGVAVSFNLAFSVFSGIAPLTATWLVKSTGSPASAGWFMAVCALLTLVGSFFVYRYNGRILSDSREREARLQAAAATS